MALSRKIYSSVFLTFLIFSVPVIVEKLEMMIAEAFSVNLFFFSEFDRSFTMVLPLAVAAVVAYMCGKRKEGISVICAVVSYLTITTLLSNSTLNKALEYTNLRADVSTVYIKNVLIAVICGLFSIYVVSHYSDIHLPNGLAFFSGKRLTPVLCTLLAFPLSFFLYFGWMAVFWMVKYISDLFYAQGNLGMSLAVAWDHMLLAVGLQGLTSRFYVLNGMNDGIILLTRCTLPLFCIFLCWQNRHRKSSMILILYMMAVGICSANDRCLSLFLLLSSIELWLLYIGCLFLSTFLLQQYAGYAYGIGILLALLMILTAHWLIKRNRYSFQWYDDIFHEIMRLRPVEIVNSMGGFDNIKSQKAENEVLTIQLYDIAYTDFSLLESADVLYRRKEAENQVLLFMGDYSALYSRQLDELMQAALDDLKL